MGCGGGEAGLEPEAQPWQSDFEIFMTHLQRTAQQSRLQNGGRIDLAVMDSVFLSRKVLWQGTLRRVYKGRPYFTESFLPMDATTKLAAVMYYPDEEDVAAWERLSVGVEVEYSGVVRMVRIDSLVVALGFPFIELAPVKLERKIERKIE